MDNQNHSNSLTSRRNRHHNYDVVEVNVMATVMARLSLVVLMAVNGFWARLPIADAAAVTEEIQTVSMPD